MAPSTYILFYAVILNSFLSPLLRQETEVKRQDETLAEMLLILCYVYRALAWPSEERFTEELNVPDEDGDGNTSIIETLLERFCLLWGETYDEDCTISLHIFTKHILEDRIRTKGSILENSALKWESSYGRCKNFYTACTRSITKQLLENWLLAWSTGTHQCRNKLTLTFRPFSKQSQYINDGICYLGDKHYTVEEVGLGRKRGRGSSKRIPSQGVRSGRRPQDADSAQVEQGRGMGTGRGGPRQGHKVQEQQASLREHAASQVQAD